MIIDENWGRCTDIWTKTLGFGTQGQKSRSSPLEFYKDKFQNYVDGFMSVCCWVFFGNKLQIDAAKLT